MPAKVDYLKIVPFAVLYAACSVGGLLLIKTAGASSVAVAGFQISWKVAAGLVIYFAGFLVYFYFLQKNDVSYVYPLFIGMNYVAVVLSAAFLLNEKLRINVYQWIGILAVLAGIVLMNIKTGSK